MPSVLKISLEGTETRNLVRHASLASGLRPRFWPANSCLAGHADVVHEHGLWPRCDRRERSLVGHLGVLPAHGQVEHDVEGNIKGRVGSRARPARKPARVGAVAGVRGVVLRAVNVPVGQTRNDAFYISESLIE